MVGTYYNERNNKNIEKIRELREKLPFLCTEFLLGIEPKTTALTRLNYCYNLKTFFDFLSKKKFGISAEEIVLADLNNLTTTDLEIYLDYLSRYKDADEKIITCTERGKARHLSCVKSLFKYFYKKNKLNANIAANIDLPKLHEKPIIRLEVDEVVKILDETESGANLSARQKMYHQNTALRDTAIMTLLLGTGIRVSECVGLNIEDLDFRTNGFRVIRKGGGAAILYFSDEVADALKRYLSARLKILESEPSERALFLSLQKKRISPRAVQMLVKKYALPVTPLKKITPHKLRSTYGTSLYRETKDIYIVADVLGHRDVNTTKKHYAAISDDLRREAANKVKLREPDTDKH